MADDKSDLVSRTVAFRQWRFSIREVILGVLAILGVFCFILFAGLYGKKSSDLDATTSKLTAATTQQCTGKSCFETHAHLEEFLNNSNAPCDNFYQLACGSFKSARKLDPGRDVYKDVFQELQQNNEAALTDILSGVSGIVLCFFLSFLQIVIYSKIVWGHLCNVSHSSGKENLGNELKLWLHRVISSNQVVT